MNKILVIGILLGIVIGLAFGPQISEALYSIPPTTAWNTIISNDNATFADNGETNVTAVSYRDTLYLISDGSINITMVPYP